MSARRDEQDDALAALTRAKRRALARTLAFMLAGALLAGATHAVIGCPTGTCVLWATPERAALYGAVMGLVVAML